MEEMERVQSFPAALRQLFDPALSSLEHCPNAIKLQFLLRSCDRRFLSELNHLGDNGPPCKQNWGAYTDALDRYYWEISGLVDDILEGIMAVEGKAEI